MKTSNQQTSGSWNISICKLKVLVVDCDYSLIVPKNWISNLLDLILR